MSKNDKQDKYDPVSYDTYRNEALKDPEIQAEYDRLKPEFDLLETLIHARNKAGMTQREVAVAMGVKHPSVARLESANSPHSPNVRTLQNYAQAVGCELKIVLEPIKKKQPKR